MPLGLQAVSGLVKGIKLLLGTSSNLVLFLILLVLCFLLVISNDADDSPKDGTNGTERNEGSEHGKQRLRPGLNDLLNHLV